MAGAKRHDRPQFAGRVRRDLIERLYASDAAGLLDSELVDEVGVGFLTRIESIFRASEARSGRPWCPICEKTLEVSDPPQDVLRCDGCSWELAWEEYKKSFRGKHLAAAGTRPFLTEYADRYPHAQTPKARFLLIDILIHRFHREMMENMGGPAARDLIGGEGRDTLDFLNGLACGDGSSQEALETREHFVRAATLLQEQREAQIAGRERMERLKESKQERREKRRQLLRQRGPGRDQS